MARGITIIEPDGDRWSLVVAEPGEGRALVSAAVVVSRPPSVDLVDSKSTGKWLAQCLDELDAPSNVLFALPRRDAVLKRVALPPGLHADELGDAVRLQMLKQLTVNAERAAIDFVPASASQGSAGVLAGALPGERLDHLRRIADAAGVKLKGVTLRCFGASRAALASPAAAEGLTLVISAGAASAEFTLVERGAVLFSRTVDLERGEIQGAGVKKVAVEAKRTWMSYRLSSEGSTLRAVVVLGVDPWSRAACEQAAAAMDVPGECVDPERIAIWPGAVGAEAAASFASLACMPLLEREAFLDFASMRKAPDRGAPRRQLALAAAFAAIVVVGAGWVFVAGALGSLRDRVSAAKSRRDELAAQYSRLLLEKARVNHLRAWQAARPDWIGHLRWISDHLPTSDLALINSVRGSLEDEDVAYAAGDTGDVVSGTWKAPVVIGFTVTGEGRGDGIAPIREKLLGSGHYVIKSDGPDAGSRFSLDLLTSSLGPPAAAAEGTP